MGEIVRCGNCGKDIGKRQRCPYCGQEQVGHSQDEIFDAQAAMRVKQAETQGSGARAVMILAVIMGLLMFAGAGLYFMESQNPTSPQPTPAPVAVEGSSATPANATEAVAGSTAVAPDAVNPDAGNQPLVVNGSTTAAAAAPADGELTEDQAIARVEAMPEVKAWMNQVTKPAFKSEGLQMGRYLIHVYEDVNDGGGQGHTTTFGFYEVDKKSGEVVKSEE